jgi:hypothetical protein
MTVFQFAVARAYSQLLSLSEQRLLKRPEVECLEVLEKAVERYESSELKVAE